MSGALDHVTAAREFVFLPTNLNKFTESKCYFLGNLVLVLQPVLRLPVQLMIMVECFFSFFSPIFYFFQVKTLNH